jgi:uncharacterized protein (DUF2249 family)
MMGKSLLLILFAACMMGGASAQTADMKRTVLFTLGENEEICYGEYFVMQKVNGDRFACIVLDTVKKTRTLVFNGKRVAEGDGLYVHYLDVNEENGYVVRYYLQDNYYVHAKGKVVGPFDIISHWGEGDKCYFYKIEGGERKHYIYSKGVLEGPFDEEDFSLKISRHADWNGKWHVNIDGEESRGYDEVGYMNLTKSGKYAYEYRENGKWHVNVNGEESMGYDRIDVTLAESGKYAYRYENDEKWYVNVNGEVSGGYYNVGYVSLTEGGKYAYEYRNDDKWHVIVNGEEGRGYDDIGRISLAESGKYAYKYKKNGDWHVNISGKESEGYNIEATDGGNFSFCYDGDDGKIYRNDDGDISETGYLSGMRFYDEIALFVNTHCDGERLIIYSTDRGHVLYSAYEYEYVVVDGVHCGKAPALYAWYDKGKNAFVWNAVEGRELVLYEYKLN